MSTKRHVMATAGGWFASLYHAAATSGAFLPSAAKVYRGHRLDECTGGCVIVYRLGAFIRCSRVSIFKGLERVMVQ